MIWFEIYTKWKRTLFIQIMYILTALKLDKTKYVENMSSM